MASKHYNPEAKDFRGRSYKTGSDLSVRELREADAQRVDDIDLATSLETALDRALDLGDAVRTREYARDYVLARDLARGLLATS